MEKSKEFTIKLPEDSNERAQILESFTTKYSLISLVNNVATFGPRQEPQLEMHPVTHLPILHD